MSEFIQCDYSSYLIVNIFNEFLYSRLRDSYIRKLKRQCVCYYLELLDLLPILHVKETSLYFWKINNIFIICYLDILFKKCYNEYLLYKENFLFVSENLSYEKNYFYCQNWSTIVLQK